MSTVVSPAVATTSGAHPVHRARRRALYIGLSLFMTVMVVVGFWPVYYGPLLSGTAVRPWIFHLHGAVFMGWMLLLVTQVALVSGGRTRTHRKLGTFGIIYGLLVLAVGLAITFVAPLMHLQSGAWDLDAAASFLALPLGDMVLFSGFFGAAVAYRRRPEIHKRLMLVATTALLFAAIARRVPLETPATFLAIWLSPLLVGMAHDWITRRRVHVVYLIGIAVLLVAFTRVYFREAETWLRIGRTLLSPLV